MDFVARHWGDDGGGVVDLAEVFLDRMVCDVTRTTWRQHRVRARRRRVGVRGVRFSGACWVFVLVAGHGSSAVAGYAVRARGPLRRVAARSRDAGQRGSGWGGRGLCWNFAPGWRAYLLLSATPGHAAPARSPMGIVVVR